MSTGLVMHEALRVTTGAREPVAELVVEETAIAFSYNGTPHAVMMATPCDLGDFALGFSLNEGIVASPDEFELVDALPRDRGRVLEIAIPAARYEALQQRRRTIAGRSGCGLCGIESLEQAIAPVPRVATSAPVAVADIIAGFEALAARQTINAMTGGVHAAGYIAGDTIIVREDVGRHNALDKLAGALARTTKPRVASGFVVITSRASYEMVHKAAMLRVGVLAAISAPTSLALKLADEAGITLIGFARGDAMNVYTHPARIR